MIGTMREDPRIGTTVTTAVEQPMIPVATGTTIVDTITEKRTTHVDSGPGMKLRGDPPDGTVPEGATISLPEDQSQLVTGDMIEDTHPPTTTAVDERIRKLYNYICKLQLETISFTLVHNKTLQSDK